MYMGDVWVDMVDIVIVLFGVGGIIGVFGNYQIKVKFLGIVGGGFNIDIG